MLNRESQMHVEIREGMRGGKGKVRIQHFFTEETDLKGQARLVGRITIDQDASIGLHSHEAEEEIYYILKGCGRVREIRPDGEEEEYEVRPGDAILTGNGGSHSIENISAEPLELIAVILTY
ncbi:MAG TPA: cupin domain-containing protein [Bacillota bacterium]